MNLRPVRHVYLQTCLTTLRRHVGSEDADVSVLLVMSSVAGTSFIMGCGERILHIVWDGSERAGMTVKDSGGQWGCKMLIFAGLA